jgi:hypothetical protein
MSPSSLLSPFFSGIFSFLFWIFLHFFGGLRAVVAQLFHVNLHFARFFRHSIAVSFQSRYTESAQFNVALLLVLGNKVFFLYRVMDLEIRSSNLPSDWDVSALKGSDSFGACSR